MLGKCRATPVAGPCWRFAVRLARDNPTLATDETPLQAPALLYPLDMADGQRLKTVSAIREIAAELDRLALRAHIATMDAHMLVVQSRALLATAAYQTRLAQTSTNEGTDGPRPPYSIAQPEAIAGTDATPRPVLGVQ